MRQGIEEDRKKLTWRKIYVTEGKCKKWIMEFFTSSSKSYRATCISIVLRHISTKSPHKHPLQFYYVLLNYKASSINKCFYIMVLSIIISEIFWTTISLLQMIIQTCIGTNYNFSQINRRSPSSNGVILCDYSVVKRSFYLGRRTDINDPLVSPSRFNQFERIKLYIPYSLGEC